MNKEFLINLIRNKLNPQQRQAFDKGLNTIRDYGKTNKVKTAEDAMRALADLGVPSEFLPSMGGLAKKNPIVGSIASLCGINTDRIEEDINKLNNKPSVSTYDVSLDTFKEDLKRLRGE